jgi:DNA-directed RNA polymerase subunit M/transcription elongation factor TFIIS
MKFCNQCESYMTKSTTSIGTIVFHCRCQFTIDGQPDDTLMAEEHMETAQSDLKHQVFIENAPFDAAANVVLKDCPQCDLNFMIMIRIGAKETTMYSCSCGFRSTHEEYMHMINTQKSKPPSEEKK